MNVSPDNVPGMGPIKFPANGEFGSGDIPVSLNKPYKYADFVNIVFKNNKNDEDEEDSVNEESMMDQIGSKDKSRSTEKQFSDYANSERAKFKKWSIERKAQLKEKFKNAKTPEEKKLLQNQFKLEVLKKKRQLSDKLKKKRLAKSKKNLKN